MVVETYLYTGDKGWNIEPGDSLDLQRSLVVVFADPLYADNIEPMMELFERFKEATVIGCSTAGEIFDDQLYSETICATFVKLEKSTIRIACCPVPNQERSYNAGKSLVESLGEFKDLRYLFVLSDGLIVNGSRLAEGINDQLAEYGLDVVVTGGLAGDGERFEKTWIFADGEIRSCCVVAVGFYGDSLHVGYGSKGGWSRFGIDRLVTKAEGNILYELDGKPALDIYKKYLGVYADELPASGLMFPLLVKEENGAKVRTILAVDERKKSITFAGDIPEGAVTAFMKSTFNNLINGAEEAGLQLRASEYDQEDALLIAISCVGRKLVLGQRVEEELEVLREMFPPSVRMSGFYSYGEIAPEFSGRCDLQNQTMMLTLLWESSR